MDALEAGPVGGGEGVAQPDPLAAGNFRSMDELRARLVEMGPYPETYDRLLDLIDEDGRDGAKDALASFFQGSPTALCFIYKLLVEAGKANAVDENIVAEIAQMHPELNENEKVAGLWIPHDSLGTKVASGGLGGTFSGSYIMHGSDDKRMCPKLQNAVNTFICRYHCLDGLMIDDNQVLCGEAIWRQAVMDKFSRDFKDADGKWKGGYIRNRFVVEQNTGDNEYQLKPNERTRPIKESAWSTEKRLQEMRKEHGEERGYDGVYEPKDAYNFDPHDLAKGPKNKELDAKKRDPIAKNASSKKEVKVADSMVDEWVGSPGSQEDPEMQELAKQDPREFMQEPMAPVDPVLLREKAQQGPVSEQDMQVIVNSGLAEPGEFVQDGNFWRYAPQGQNPSLAKKDKQTKTAFNLSERKGKEGSSQRPFNLSKQAKDMNPVLSFCSNPQCPARNARIAYVPNGICPRCGQKSLQSKYSEEVTMESGGIEKPKQRLVASVTFANGAYMAKKGSVRAFGKDEAEALSKLADLVEPEQGERLDLDELQPGSAMEESEEIKTIMEPQIVPEEEQQPPAETLFTDPEVAKTDDDINADIEQTQWDLTPEDYQELEELEEAMAAGPDPKSDLPGA